MGRLIRTVAAVFLAVGGLAAAAAVPAWASKPAGLGPRVRVLNLHSAYEAHLGQTRLGKIAGITYARGKGPRASRTAKANTICSEPNCPLQYGGGVVQHSPHVYLLFWGPTWSSNTGEEASATYLESFYQGLGVQTDDSWSTTTDQYTDSTGQPRFSGTVYKGAFQDTSTPPTGVTQAQLQSEADAFVTAKGLTDLPDAQIVIATQSGTCPQGFYAPSCAGGSGSYCAWHSNSGSNETYTNLPYLLDSGAGCGEGFINTPGTHDGFSIVGGHEYAETITDPFPVSGWYDNSDPYGGEIGDKCAWAGSGWGGGDPAGNVVLSTGTFAMQSLWSNAAFNATGAGCVMSTVQTSTAMSSAGPAVVGQPVTYTATVSPVPDGGKVAFTDDGSPLSGCGSQPVNTSTGEATCTHIYTTTVGSPHSIKAGYSGDAGYTPSSSSPLAERVIPATSTALSPAPNPAVVGQTVTYTATVSPVPDGGTVAFTDGGGAISGCASVAVSTSTGEASCQATYATTAGSPHSIKASYADGPSPDFGASSSTVSETIDPLGTSTTLSSSADPVGVGAQVTYTAAVSPVPDGGTVAFTDGGSTISGCGSQPVSTSTGEATCQVTYPTNAGSPHSIKAGYSGNADYQSSQSSAVAQNVEAPRVTVSGAPKSTGNGVRVKLACSGLTGQSCQVRVTLMTTETLVGGKPIAVSASAAKKKHKAIPVGAKSVTIAAGQSATITVKLNAKGRSLLKQFGKLPVIVSIKLQLNGRKVTVATRKVTIKPRKHRGKSLDLFVPGPLIALRF